MQQYLVFVHWYVVDAKHHHMNFVNIQVEMCESAHEAAKRIAIWNRILQNRNIQPIYLFFRKTPFVQIFLFYFILFPFRSSFVALSPSLFLFFFPCPQYLHYTWHPIFLFINFFPSQTHFLLSQNKKWAYAKVHFIFFPLEMFNIIDGHMKVERFLNWSCGYDKCMSEMRWMFELNLLFSHAFASYNWLCVRASVLSISDFITHKYLENCKI